MDPEKHNTLIRFLRIALTETSKKNLDTFEDVRDGVDLVDILNYCFANDKLWQSACSEKDSPFEKIEAFLTAKYGLEHLDIQFNRLQASHRDTLELAKVIMLIMISCMNEGQYVEAMKECDFMTQTNIFDMHNAVDKGGGVLESDWYSILMISDQRFSPDVSTCSPFKMPRGRRSRSLVNITSQTSMVSCDAPQHSSCLGSTEDEDVSPTIAFNDLVALDCSEFTGLPTESDRTAIDEFMQPSLPSSRHPRVSLMGSGDGNVACSQGLSAAQAGARLRARSLSSRRRQRNTRLPSEEDLLEDSDISIGSPSSIEHPLPPAFNSCSKSEQRSTRRKSVRMSLAPAGARSIRESLHRGNITFRSPTADDEFVYSPATSFVSAGRKSRSRLTISPLSASYAFGRKSMMGAEDLRNLRRAISNRSIAGEQNEESPIEKYQNSPVAKYKSRLNNQVKYSQQLEGMLAEANDKVKIEETKTESLAKKVDELAADLVNHEKQLAAMKQENERLATYRSPTRDKIEFELHRYKMEANKFGEAQDLKNMYIRENQALQKQVENLEIELKRARTATESCEKKMNALSNLFESSAEEHESEILKLNQQLEMCDSYKRNANDLGDTLNILEVKHEKVEKERGDLVSQLETLQKEFEDLKDHASGLKETHDERTHQHEQKEEQWMQDLQTQRLMYDELLKKNKLTDAELASKISCYESLIQQNQALQEENVSLRDAKASFDSEINAKAESIEWETKILNDRMAEERTTNQHHVTVLEEKLAAVQETLRQKLEASSAKERSLQADLTKSEKIQAALRAELKEFEEKMDVESAELQSQLSAASEMASEMEFKYLALKDEIEELSSKSEFANREHRITVDKLNSDWKLKVEKLHTKQESDQIQHQNEVKEIRLQLSEAEKLSIASRTELEAKIEDLELNNHELHTQNGVLVENLSTFKQTSDSKVADLLKQVDMSRTLLAAAKEESSALRADITKLGCEREQLTNDLAEAKENYSNSSTLLSKTQVDLDSLQQKYLAEKSSLECNIKSLKTALSDKERQFSTEMQQAKAGHAKQIDEMKDTCKADVENLHGQLQLVTKALQNKLSNKQNELEQMERERNDMRNRFSELNQQMTVAETRIRENEADLDETRAKLEKASLVNKSFTVEVSELKLRLIAEESAKSHLTDQLQAKTAEYGELEISWKELTEKLETNERINGEQRSDLFAQLDIYHKKKTKWQEEKAEMTAKQNRYMEENLKLQIDLKSAIVAKDVAEKQVKECDSELTSVSHQLQSERETGQAERLEQEKALAEQRDLVEELQEKLHQSEENNNGLKVKLKHLTTKAEKARGLREIVSVKDKTISELTNDLLVVKQRAEALSNAKADVMDDLARSHARVSQLQAECEALQHEANAFQRQDSLGPHLRMRQYSGESTSTRTSAQSAPIHIPRINLFETDDEPEMNYSTSVTVNKEGRPFDDVCFKQPEVPRNNRLSTASALWGGESSFGNSFTPSGSLPCLSESSDMSLTLQNGPNGSSFTPLRKEMQYASDAGGTPDANRLLELNRRNKMVGHALRDSYIAETGQFGDIPEADIKGRSLRIPESVMKRDALRQHEQQHSHRKRIAASGRFSPANAMGKLKKRFSKENNRPISNYDQMASVHRQPVRPSVSFEVPLTPAGKSGSGKQPGGELASETIEDGDLRPTNKKKPFVRNPLRSQNQ